VKYTSFKNKAESAPWKAAGHNTGLNFHYDLKLTILRMKMRWCMFAVTHINCYSKETAYFRHFGLLLLSAATAGGTPFAASSAWLGEMAHGYPTCHRNTAQLTSKVSSHQPPEGLL
jgi:hypothetical protein